MKGLASVLVLCLAAGAGYCQYVEDSIDVGGWNVASMVYNSRAGVVYGTCYYGHSVFAIACSTNELIASIPVNRYPIGLAYNSIDNKAYCTFYYHDEDSVLVIDGTTHQRVKAFPLDGAYYPVWDAASNRLYVNCYDYDRVAVLDCRTDSVLALIPVPGEPVCMTVNAKRRKLYVQNDVDMTVSVIDMNTNQVIRNVYVGSWFFCAAYSEAADRYYCNGERGVAAICGAGDTLIKQITLPQGYQALAMLPVDAESLVMVAAYSGGSDSVFVIDVAGDVLRSALRVGRQPEALTLSSRTNLVYCANAVSNSLSVITADGSRVVKTVSVGDSPFSMALSPDQQRLYVGHAREWVYVIRDRLGIVEDDIAATAAERSLLRATPNPFTTRVRFEWSGTEVSTGVAIYSQSGQIAARLSAGCARAGDCVWDGRDERGRLVAAGVYFAVVEGIAAARVRLVKTE